MKHPAGLPGKSRLAAGLLTTLLSGCSVTLSYSGHSVRPVADDVMAACRSVAGAPPAVPGVAEARLTPDPYRTYLDCVRARLAVMPRAGSAAAPANS